MAEDDKVAALEKRIEELEDLSKTRFYMTITGIVVSIVLTCLLWLRFADFQRTLLFIRARDAMNEKQSSSVPDEFLKGFVPVQQAS